MLELLAPAMLILQRTDESDVVDWLIKIVIGFIFVGLPLIKGILQSREKAKEHTLADDRRAAREKESEGRRAFEELMRGGTTLAPPPIAAPPPPVPARSAETHGRSAETHARSAQRTPHTIGPKPLTEREEIPAAPLTGSEFEAVEGAPEGELAAQIERRDSDELARQQAELARDEEITRAEYAASSSLRESVAPVPVEVFRAPAPELPGSASTAPLAQRLLGGTRGADRRAALRRALVLNEVLGRPVAARDGSDASQPVGLRG